MLDKGEGLSPVLLLQERPRRVQDFFNLCVQGLPLRPPFALDLSPPLVHAGTNELKIVVANTAINELAGRAGPDYRLLNLRYGEKFTPQDMDHLEPLPSGILGSLRLVSKQDEQKENQP